MLTLVSNVKIKIIQYHDERFLELLLELAERRQAQLLHFFVQPIRADANSCLVTIEISTNEVSIIFFILFRLLLRIKS